MNATSILTQPVAHANLPWEIHKVYVILNPVAGINDANQGREQIEQFCQSHQWACEIHETVKDENLRILLGHVVKTGYDLVLVLGGDGTISAVVDGMINSGVPLGIVPAGTGNMLARNLNIPLNVADALAILDGDFELKSFDVMQIEDNYFVMNVSIGISASIMRDTSRSEKQRFGMFAYLWRGIQSIFKARMHHFQAEVDQRRVRFSAAEIFIANDKLMGLQPLMEGVEVSPGDQQLDLFIVRARNMRDYLNVAFRFLMLRKNEEDHSLRYLPIKERVHIQSARPMSVQADGEVIGKTPLEIRLVPHALKILVPMSKAVAKQ